MAKRNTNNNKASDKLPPVGTRIICPYCNTVCTRKTAKDHFNNCPQRGE